MGHKVNIADGTGSTFRARVTPYGQVVTAPIHYDDTAFNNMGTADTAYNFFTPKAGHRFIVTGIISFADKNVSDATDTDISLYESSTAASTTESKILVEWGQAQLTTVYIGPLNIIVTEGVYINGKTGDDDVHMTVTGYYLKTG